MIAYGVDSAAVLGIMEIGVFLSLVMFGVVTLQGYIYFQNCRGDRTGLKLLVGSLLFFELCHSVASCHAIYYFTVILAGIPELQKSANNYSLSLIPVFETIITAIVQGFFAYRIRLLSGRLHISLICWGLCVVRFVGGMAMASESFLDIPREPDYFVLQETYGWLISSALFVGAILDVLIAVSLCFYIQKLYTPYNLPRGEELIRRLIAWTIETGLITSLGSVAVVIAFQTMKFNFIWLALYTLLAKLYSNSLLVSLNARSQRRITARAPSPMPTRPSSSNITIQISRIVEDDVHTLVHAAGSLQVPEKAAFNKTAYNLV
ncbi:hypothetical protein K438DRAFT_1929758 [Mycena galopus ATCC 62051]|nr:hypothetical protein K438DRAFT_1929758 [Mycena galopus ATCC 62051]